MRVDTLTPEIAAVPGTTVSCRLRIVNEAPAPAALSLRVLGLGAADSRLVPGEPLRPGEAFELVVPLAIPDTFTDGHHALAIEVRSDGPGQGTVLAPLIINVSSLDRVIMRILPNVLRGHRTKRFVLEVDNRRDEPVAVALQGEGTALSVRLEQRSVHLERKQMVRVRGRVRGPLHLSGDELQHVVTVSGHGSAVPTYATASFTQRPTFARGLRGLMAGLAILGLWAGLLGGGLFLLNKRSTPSLSGAVAPTANLDRPGTSGAPGTAGLPGSDAGGGSAPGDGGGNGVPGGGGGAAGGALPAGVVTGAPTSTLVRGTVKAGSTGKNGDVVVTLTPLVGGQGSSTTVSAAGAGGGAPAASALLSRPDRALPAVSGGIAAGHGGGRTASAPTDDQTKFWSVRSGTYSGGSHLIGAVGTISVETRNSDTDGAFTFDGVALRRSYEVNFAKPGFDTQSFEITPTDDGKPVEMKVVLQPGKGELGGSIRRPDGQGLGGASLSISDGTLSFTTTSSTDAASRGQWSIDGLSTPATYTVTATLAGYGTEVAEITLGPKDRRTDIVLTMSDQVGSISGTVRGNGGPLGGVTLTASNGTTTRTTNSYTAGVTGGYLFPGLTKGVDYTITASAPGFSTQTRVVRALPGNATGIDFELVSTFATVTGMVISVDSSGARPNAPLPNASIELSRDGLKVRSSSAISPDPGSFTLTNLPPGDYTLTVGRYDHTSFSRPVSLTAGQNLDVGDILLTFTPRAQISPTGSLTLTIDKLINGSPAPLDNVSITLVDVGGRIAVTNPPPASVTGSYRYERLPIGTYRLLVERDGYRPFTVARINIGLSNVDQAITMLKFGQAFGQVIDPLSATPQNDYQLLLYEQQPAGLVCRGLLSVAPNEPVDGQGKIRWQVGVDLQLLSGEYVIRFRPAPGDIGTTCSSGGRLPKGHVDQPDAGGNAARFTVAVDNDNPIQIPDIPVYPYPTVSGLVLAPNFAGGSVTFAGLDALVAADLVVTLDCGTGTTVDAALTRTGTAASFTFDRIAVGGLFGQAPIPVGGVLPVCTVKAKATSYADVVAQLPTALMIPTALPYQDRVVNIALVDNPDVLLGTMYWIDRANGNPVFVGGANVAAPGAIVAFGAGQANDPDGPGPQAPGAPNPPPVLADLSTTTAAGTGAWSFPGVRQVFGTATYTFTHPTTLTGSFDLTITQTDRTISATSGLDQPLVDDGLLDIVVVPRPGAIAGQVSIVTTRSPAPFSDAIITATPPGAAATDVGVSNGGAYSISPAAAGTWDLALGGTATSNLVAAPGTGTQQVFVGAADTAVNAAPFQYIELGQIVTNFTDSNGNPVGTYTSNGVQYPRMNVALTGGGPGQFPAWTDRSEVADANGRATARLVSVSSFLPTLIPLTYHLTYQPPGYELDRTTWKVYDDNTGALINSGTGTAAFDVSVRAGTRLRVELSAPKFGSISGAVRGLTNPPSTAPGDVEPLDLDTGLTVTAQQVQDAAGTEFPVPAPIVPATRTAGPPPGFIFGVRAGYYLVTYSHPDFVSATRVIQVLEGTAAPADVDLDIARGSFQLSVVTDEVSSTPVDQASVRLWPAGTPIGSIGTVTPSYSGVTGADGSVDFDPDTGTGIIPGSYLVVIRKTDPLAGGRDVNFPVIATVTVPRGATPVLRTVTKRAVAPRTDASITGVVTATNGFRPVSLPAFAVTRTYTTPQATGPNALPNSAADADQQRAAQQASRAFDAQAGSSQAYRFDELAAGSHELTFADAAGFTTPAAIAVTVDGTSTATAPTATYVANSVQVRITLTGVVDAPAHPDVGVSITSPAGGAAAPATEDPAAPGTWVVDAVLPESAAYTIAITGTHYRVDTPAQLSLDVPPSVGPVTHSVAVTPLSILTGTATKRISPTTTGPVTEADSVTLRRASDDSVVATTTPDSGGGYSFVVTTVEALRVRVVVSGFKPATVDVPAFGSAADVAVPTVFVDKYATATLTVAGAPAGTATVTPTPATGVSVVQSPPGVYQVAGLDPDVGYGFAIAAPGFLSQTYPTTGTLTPAIGSSTTATITLEAPKSISGTTFKAGTATKSTVTLLQGTTTVSGPTATAADGTYSFVGLGYGTYTVRAAAAGVGAGQLPGIDIAIGQPSPVGRDITLAARPLTVQFTISPVAAVPTITVNGATGTAGQTTFTFPEDGNLAFTVTAPGYDNGGGTILIPANWNGTSNVAASATLTLTPPPPVTATVAGTVTGATTDFPATVHLCPATATDGATCATSTTSAAVAATGGSFSFATVAVGNYKAVAENGAGVFTPLVALAVDSTGTVTPAAVALVFA